MKFRIIANSDLSYKILKTLNISSSRFGPNVALCKNRHGSVVEIVACSQEQRDVLFVDTAHHVLPQMQVKALS